MLIAGGVFAVMAGIGLVMTLVVGGAFYQYQKIEEQILTQPEDADQGEGQEE